MHTQTGGGKKNYWHIMVVNKKGGYLQQVQQDYFQEGGQLLRVTLDCMENSNDRDLVQGDTRTVDSHQNVLLCFILISQHTNWICNLTYPTYFFYFALKVHFETYVC